MLPSVLSSVPAEVIDRAVADGSIDIGVHSLKDTPITLPDRVELAACLPRDDPRCVNIVVRHERCSS
jgi:hydroxymethylbilane synthase